jgi:tetratricopeptide (TPR) repeat protein
VKRVYGYALANRNMAQQLFNRANTRRREGRLAEADQDLNIAREHALRSMEYWRKVIAFDDEMAQTTPLATQRVSASLKPDAFIGLASCEIVLGDATTPDHFERAVGYIEQYAEIARNARKFWMDRRERLLVEDPLRMGSRGESGAATLSMEERQRYEVKILNTIRKEIAVRQAMMETYLFLNRYPDAIQEAGRILDLDPETHDVLLLRGRAFAMLNPPNYDAALKDLRAYRATRDLSRLTEDLVKLNRLIQTYEERLQKQRSNPSGS